jgi:hypothetical protein
MTVGITHESIISMVGMRPPAWRACQQIRVGGKVPERLSEFFTLTIPVHHHLFDIITYYSEARFLRLAFDGHLGLCPSRLEGTDMTLLTNIARSIASAALPAVLLLIGATAARAGEVTWNYVGNPFFFGPAGAGLLGDSLEASVTFDGPLPANQVNQDFSAHIVSWQVWDSAGFFSFTSSDGVSTLSTALFTTDAQGNILSNFGHEPDEFVVSSAAVIDRTQPSYCINGTCETFFQAFFGFTDPPVGDLLWYAWITSGATPVPGNNTAGLGGFADLFTQNGAIAYDASFDPGVWTEAAPEPGTILLLGSGLLGLAAVRKRKRVR